MCLGKRWEFTYLNAHAERLLEAVRRDLLGYVIWEAFPAAIDSPPLSAPVRGKRGRAPRMKSVARGAA